MLRLAIQRQHVARHFFGISLCYICMCSHWYFSPHSLTPSDNLSGQILYIRFCEFIFFSHIRV